MYMYMYVWAYYVYHLYRQCGTWGWCKWNISSTDHISRTAKSMCTVYIHVTMPHTYGFFVHALKQCTWYLVPLFAYWWAALSCFQTLEQHTTCSRLYMYLPLLLTVHSTTWIIMNAHYSHKLHVVWLCMHNAFDLHTQSTINCIMPQLAGAFLPKQLMCTFTNLMTFCPEDIRSL